MKTVRIFIDTTVLYHTVEYNFNIEDKVQEVFTLKYDIFVHPKVEEEVIEALTRKGKIAKQAKFAMQISAKFLPYNDEREYAGADMALFKTAQREEGVVFTYDKDLRDKCKNFEVPVLTHYKKGRLQLIGYVD